MGLVYHSITNMDFWHRFARQKILKNNGNALNYRGFGF